MRKFIVMPLLAALFWASAFYVLGQFNFRTGPELRLSVRVPRDGTLRLYYDGGLQPGSEKSLEAELKGSKTFRLVSFTLPAEAAPPRLRIASGEGAGGLEIKSISLTGFLSSRTWFPRDIVRDFSIENGNVVFEDEGRFLKVAGGGVGPVLAYDGDFSVPYGEVRAGMARRVFSALWATVLTALVLLAMRFTSFFRVRLRGRSAFDIALSALFIVLLILPTARERLYRSKRVSAMQDIEKRALAPKPDFKIGRIFDFPAEFDRYYNDNFSFRKKLIRWHNRLKTRYLKISPLRGNVVLGRDGWIFWTGDGVLRDYDGSWQYSDEELEVIKDTLIKRRDWLRERGAAFYMLVAPNKHTIYPEYLPDSIKKFSPRSRLDNLLEYLRRNTDIKIIDVRDEMIREKAAERVYYKMDTHWNQYGAFIAYRKLITEVAKDFPRIRPLSLTDFNIKRQPHKAGDIGKMLSLDTDLEEEDIVLEPKGGFAAHEVPYLYGEEGTPYSDHGVARETDKDGLPRLVMFRDSFSYAIVPYLSENFRRSVYLWTHNFPSALGVIEKEKPDVVIHELVERFQHHLLQKYYAAGEAADASPDGKALPLAK